MIYRTAHRAAYRSLNNNLGMLSYRIAQLTNQIASEKRINTPSDDPSGAANVLGTRTTLSNIKQYQTNLGVADLWLNDSGAAVQSIKETLDTIYTLTEQGATDSYSAEQRQIIANEINVWFQSLIQDGNHDIGGSYIFSGQRVTTQPFSLQVEAHKVIAGCQNSDKWTGKVQNYGDATFNNRPDLPVQSQKFLIEVVQAGGVDSRYYSNSSPLSTAVVNGNGYRFDFQATDRKYNNTEIKFVAGPANVNATGSASANNGLTYGVSNAVSGPVKVNYVLGSSAATTAQWDNASNTLTVSLQTRPGKEVDGNLTDPPQSVATAEEVRQALENADPPLPAGVSFGLTDGNNGTGTVNPGTITFNQKTTVDVRDEYQDDGSLKSTQITVYLERDENGNFKAGPEDIERALNEAVGSGLPEDQRRLTVSLTRTSGDPGLTVTPLAASTKLQTGTPYTLAHTTINPKGTQNDLIWSIKNHTAFTGEAGNNFSVEYRVPQNRFETNPDPAVECVLGDDGKYRVVVNVAVSAAVYDKTFVQLYNSPGSGAYQDAARANEMALEAAVLTTANEVRDLAANGDFTFKDSQGNDLGLKLSDVVDVSLADGSSGLGKINRVPETSFTDGYDQPALFRVSQDGGKTWGPPMSFAASEYETGDMFHNAFLGHASLTTGLKGKGSNLVFTAKQQGTWGNDVRVEYKLPESSPSQAASVEVGPNPWNICVTLATDEKGQVVTTADDIMNLVNNHPVASQLVTADLANYHEGGSGRVDAMECLSLAVGEPYQVNGQTVITALGHAGATVGFGYSPPAQSDPNIVFQALQQGPDGNDIGIRYTTSADPTYYSDPALANESYQSNTTVRYETGADGRTVVVVHLASEPLPSCPDPDEDREASDAWKEKYPLYSCTETRAVTATAGSIVQAVIDKNTESPQSAVVWASLERWPEGWDSTAKVGVTDGTVWLTGGNDTDDAANHGVNLKFIPDGTSLQVGDVFEVPVGWYHGDEKNIDINAGSDYRTTMNTTGNSILGGNGEDDNILDSIQRLIWALEHNDSELVGKELPIIRSAIEKVTTLETKIGASLIRNEFVTKNLDTARYNAEDYLSKVEDADFSQLITDLKNAQTVYEACLGATGLTRKVSLLNYI